MPTSTLRATVQQDGTTAGQSAVVLVDGADTFVTANGVAGYVPQQDDRVLVQQVGSQVEIIQFLDRTYITGQTIRTAPSGKRIEMTSNDSILDGNEVIFYSDLAGESSAARVSNEALSAGVSSLVIGGTQFTGSAQYPNIELGTDTSAVSRIAVDADLIVLGFAPADKVEVDGSLALGSNVGTISTTTNASGQVTVTHGLPFTPRLVLAHNYGSGGAAHWVGVVPGTITSTQFTLVVRNLIGAGATVNSTAVDLRWIAIG